MVLRSHWLPDKAEVVAEHGMVVAKHPLAADAGIEILQEGGNAVDAAVATGFALCVVKPMMTGIGGIGYLLLHDAARGEQWCFDGAPRAPLAARPDIYEVIGESTDGIGLYQVRSDENKEGYRAPAVPGVVAILCGAHERYGRLPLSRVLEPAIRLAADGWPVDWLTVAHTANGMRLLSSNREAASIFLPSGRPPAWGPPAERLVQRDLAETLRRIARDGTDGFYGGDIADAIDRDMRENGGLIARQDLARYPRRVERPLAVRYRGVEALIPPMPCGATTALETLRILERFDLAGAGQNSVESLHLFIEAARRAYADRFHYLGDPEFVPVPLTGLLSDGHADDLAAHVRRDRASMTAAPGDAQPWVRFGSERPAGDPWRFDPGRRPAPVTAGAAGDDGDTCTTHFAVVDRDRNAVNCTITAAGLFGAGVVTPTTGILWNNGMTWFNPVPGTANSIAPGKRALTNMSPVIVLRDGRPWFVVGAPGGRKIVNAVAQVIGNVVDHGMSLQQAITAPRIDASANETLADIRLDPAVVEALRERGHIVTVVEDSTAQAMFARPLGILIDPEDGRLHSGLSPAHMAEARGM
jgi:gamma-glutamyltranspeptidase / glutathione hydrolase